MKSNEQLLASGKTKEIYTLLGSRTEVRVRSKDDITAGDGEKHHVLANKAVWANLTTCNVFRLLAWHNLPLAYIHQLDHTSFKARFCTMYPFEVVVRAEADGSYVKRFPEVERGQKFRELKTEFYLKTKDRKWGAYDLPVDDPLLFYNAETGQVSLYRPSVPFLPQAPFLVLPMGEILPERAEKASALFDEMGKIARDAFVILKTAWLKQGGDLIDFKVEFGCDSEGRLLLADVIDNDSWRVKRNGEYLDKQVYRDGHPLDEVVSKYALVADLTSAFATM